MKPLLLGEAPSRLGDRYWMLPLSGRPSKVLCQLAGIDPLGDSPERWTWALRSRFDCLNLVERYADATTWRPAVAAELARELEPELSGRVVVCLGRKVHRAIYDGFDLGRPPEFYEHGHFAEYDPQTHVTGFSVIAIPHPSGLNRLLNDREQRYLCGMILRAAINLAVPA